MKNKQETHEGLAGIVVTDTHLSEVDGDSGRLIIHGRDVEDVADMGFEALAESLLEATGAKEKLRAGRAQAFERLPLLGDALDRPDGMDALRAAMGHESALSPKLGGPRAGAEIDEALRLIGATATYVAAWSRRQRGLAPLMPSELGHAADYLRMITGEHRPLEAAGLEAYLSTVADHGLNASTFAARVAASTGTDLASSLVAAVGTLKGPLHGGAPGPVLDMLDTIALPSRAEGFIEAELLAGRRIMGMGHRIYRVRDPRARVLERSIVRLEEASPRPRLALARAVERAAELALAQRHPGRALKANVEFYTAVLLEAVGLERAAFSPTFAVGRSVGWAAHVLEQRRYGRLIRPEARYIGPRP